MPVDNPPWATSYGPGVPLHLQYDRTTLTDQLERTVARWPERTALDFLGRSTTWAALSDRVARVAEGLRRLGVAPGDSVALVMPNCPQNVIAFQAVLRLGATVVEHNPLYTAGELRHPFADHGARVAIVWDKVVPVVEALRGVVRRSSTSSPSTSPPSCRWPSGSRCGCRSRRPGRRASS